MKKLYTILVLTCLINWVSGQELEYYLPQDISYDTSISKPQEVIGHEVGEWHVTHDKLVQYMNTLAQQSDRISIENRGSTFEGRPILLLKNNLSRKP